MHIGVPPTHESTHPVYQPIHAGWAFLDNVVGMPSYSTRLCLWLALCRLVCEVPSTLSLQNAFLDSLAGVDANTLRDPELLDTLLPIVVTNSDDGEVPIRVFLHQNKCV